MAFILTCCLKLGLFPKQFFFFIIKKQFSSAVCSAWHIFLQQEGINLHYSPIWHRLEIRFVLCGGDYPEYDILAVQLPSKANSWLKIPHPWLHIKSKNPNVICYIWGGKKKLNPPILPVKCAHVLYIIHRHSRFKEYPLWDQLSRNVHDGAITPKHTQLPDNEKI